VLIQFYPALKERTATDLLSLLFLQREIKQPNEEALAKPDDINVEAVKEHATLFSFQLRAIVAGHSRPSGDCATTDAHDSSASKSPSSFLYFGFESC
jgi:hypothetical protein